MQCRRNSLCGLRNGHYGRCEARNRTEYNDSLDVFDVALGVAAGELIADVVEGMFDSNDSSSDSFDFGGGDFGGGGSDGDW